MMPGAAGAGGEGVASSSSSIACSSNCPNQIRLQFLACAGHEKKAHGVSYICCEASWEILASVGQYSVQFWSLTFGQCIHELKGSWDQFYSCAFHPSNATFLMVGGTQVTLATRLLNCSLNICSNDFSFPR